jgi:uncharacterized membrane protein YidH (DUF202 family)
MVPRRIPSDLASLIHHVELSQAGWRDRSLELLVMSAVDVLGTAADPIGITASVNTKIAATLGRAQIEQLLDRLEGTGKIVRTAAGHFKLSESTSAELHEQFQEAARREEMVRSQFSQCFGDAPEGVDVGWPDFCDGFLVPLVSELGARSYELLSGEDVAMDGADAYMRFLDKFPEEHRPWICERINQFVDPQQPAVRGYVLRLLNAAFLVQALTLSESALTSVLERTSRTLRLKVFVDTNFLFSLIGLHENPADDVVDALHVLINDLKDRVNIKLYMIPITVDEARRTIEGYASRLADFRFSKGVARSLHDGSTKLSGITLKFVRAAAEADGRLSAKEYFGDYSNNLLDIARSKGVELFNESTDPLRTRQDVIDDLNDQMEWEKNRKSEERRKSYEKVLHDMVLWHFAKDKRRTRIDSPMDADSWVATIDFGLLGFDRHKQRGRKQTPPVCVHPTVLLQLLQMWVPTNPKLEAALLESLRPMLPHIFDREAEQVTIRILRSISRFENAEDLSPETVANILLNDAVRSRIGAAPTVEDEIDIVKTALTEENRALELRAKQLDREREGLSAQVKAKESELRTALSDVDALSQEVAIASGKLADEYAARKNVEKRLDAVEERSERRMAWGISGVSTVAVVGMTGWLASWVWPQAVARYGLGGSSVLVGLVLIGLGLAVLAFASSRFDVTSNSGWAKHFRRLALALWVTIGAGLLIEYLADLLLN